MSESKRLQEARKKIDTTKSYGLDEALALAKDTSQVKFDAAIEAHFRLGIDIKQTDQQVRGTVILPHGTGKTVKVAAFVTDDKAAAAKKAGADIVGHADLIAEIKKTGKCNFDVAVAMPEVMKDLAVIARTLGQRGLMPNPKTGTITPKIEQAIKELKQGKLAFKNDSFGNIHAVIGRVSFDTVKLKENFETLVESIRQGKPEKIKGVFLRSIHLSSSMGPSIKVSL